MGQRKYRNTGAPFETEDGRTVERGDVAELSETDARRRIHKLEPMIQLGDEEPEPQPDPWEAVDFASSAARELAEEEGLEPADFDGVLGTGQGHSFRKTDVEELMEGSD